MFEHLDAERGDGVFDARRNLGEDLARDQAVAFQLAQSLGKRLLADALHLLHDLREANRSAGFSEHADGPQRPLVGQAGDHLAGQAIFDFGESVADGAALVENAGSCDCEFFH